MKNYFTKDEVDTLVEENNASLRADLAKIKEEVLK